MLNTVSFTLLCLIWGSTWLAIKIGLEGSPPFLGAGFRFAMAGAFLFVATALSRKWNFAFKRLWPPIILAGLFTYPIAYSLVYWGEQYIDSGLAAVLFAVMPFFVAILAHNAFENERLTIIKIIGMLIGFGGILIIFGDSLKIKGSSEFLGMVCMVGASFSAAVGTIIMKKHIHNVNLLPILSVQISIGATVLLVLGFSLESISAYRIDIKTIGSLLYLAVVGTSVAFSLYFYLLKKMEATKLSMIAFITPVVALILGVAFKSENFDAISLLGSALVVFGVFMVVEGSNIHRHPTKYSGLPKVN